MFVGALVASNNYQRYMNIPLNPWAAFNTSHIWCAAALIAKTGRHCLPNL